MNKIIHNQFKSITSIILLFLVLASDEFPDLKPPEMRCKPKQKQHVSYDDDDIIFIKEEKR